MLRTDLTAQIQALTKSWAPCERRLKRVDQWILPALHARLLFDSKSQSGGFFPKKDASPLRTAEALS